MVNALQTFSKKIDPELVEPAKIVTIGRKLVPVTAPQGFGVTSVDWGQISGMSDGHVGYGFTSGNEDVIDIAMTNVKVPVYWKDYKVNRRTYEGWLQNNSTNIDTASAVDALYRTIVKEDVGIIQGIVNKAGTYDIKGLYQSATSTVTDTYDFGTYGQATKALAAAKKELVDAGIPAYSIPLNMVLPSTQYGELEASESANGVEETPKIEKMLNGGAIFSVSETVLPESDGMVLPAPRVAKPYFDYFLTQNYATEHGFDSNHPDTSDLTGRVYTAGILRVKQPKAICQLQVI